MRAKIEQLLYVVRSSYWFVPALLAVAAIVASQVLVQIDRSVDQQWLTDSQWIGMNQPDGARALLATVAGSMITVAGTTFSLTILAVSYATSHFGPRLLDNFMRDRGNQITLGTFVATFLYCLLVLRTIRSESTPQGATDVQIFVPHLSIAVAILLTLTSVGVLIYFIHHVPESINISNVLENIGATLSEKTDELYPQKLGDEAEPDIQTDFPWQHAVEVKNRVPGYLQGIDQTALMNFTRDHDVVMKLEVRPGDYLLSGQIIARLISRSGDPAAELPSEDECADKIHGSVAIGSTRTHSQDLFFVINQYVEIATRALSPGVNDPFTAIQCIDHLANALARLSNRQLPSSLRMDEDGVLRVITTTTDWDKIVHCTIGQLLPYVERDPNVIRYMRDSIERVLLISKNETLNDCLSQSLLRLPSPG